MWWYTRRNHISSLGENGRVHLNRQGLQFSRTTGSRGVRISGSNAGYTMFRGSVKGTGYPLHSPVSPSILLPCVTVCHHMSTGLYQPCFSLHRFRVSDLVTWSDRRFLYSFQTLQVNAWLVHIIRSIAISLTSFLLKSLQFSLRF